MSGENRVEITTYKGWVIYFNVHTESFYAISEVFDRDKTKPSFASMKKFIDDFSKENQNFKPFWMEALPEKGYRREKIFIIGIRLDGRFVYSMEGTDEKFQLSSYDEIEYVLPSEELTQAKLTLKELNNEVSKLQKQISTIKESVTPKGRCYLGSLRDTLKS